VFPYLSPNNTNVLGLIVEVLRSRLDRHFKPLPTFQKRFLGSVWNWYWEKAPLNPGKGGLERRHGGGKRKRAHPVLRVALFWVVGG
jgi:hypothetical protein